MNRGLPRAALMSLWLGAWLRGEESADDLLARLDDGHEPVAHVLTGLPGATGAEPVTLALGRLRRVGAIGARLALPGPGDPVGLGGPAPFNLEALDAGEAVLLDDAGLGLVPVRVGGALEWRAMPAAPAPYVDRAESSTGLLSALHAATELFVDLDVASWQPDIPDLLLNQGHHVPLHLPRRFRGPDTVLMERALLSWELVDLARGKLGGSLHDADVERCRTALADLDRAARRMLISLCG